MTAYHMLLALGVLAVTLTVGVTMFGAWRARAGTGTRKLPPARPAWRCMTWEWLGDGVFSLMDSVRSLFARTWEEAPDDADVCPECGLDCWMHYSTCSQYDDDDDDQPRPTPATPPGGPGLSTEEQETLAWVESLHDDPPAVSASLIPVEDGVLAVVTHKPVNPWVNPAFAQEVMPLDAVQPDRRCADDSSALVDVPRRGGSQPFFDGRNTAPGHPSAFTVPFGAPGRIPRTPRPAPRPVIQWQPRECGGRITLAGAW